MVRNGLTLAAGAVLVAGIYAAGGRGLADAHYLTARTALTYAADSKRPPAERELDAAEQALRYALALEPSNPLFVEQLGRVFEMRALRVTPRDAAAREFLQKSLAQFRAAAILRPGSPHVWSGIAALKLRLDDMDFEFYGALDRADRLGRWEPAVQLALVDIGFAGWPWLAQPAKILVLDAVRRGMILQAGEMRRVAAAHGTFALVCADALLLHEGTSGLCVKK